MNLPQLFVEQLFPQRHSHKQPCKRDGVNVCFYFPFRKRWEEWAPFFCRRPPLLPVQLPKTREAAESRPSPAWGIHKVQQNEDKTLPAALSKRRDGLKWGTLDRLSMQLLPSTGCRDFPCSVICHLRHTSASTGKPDRDKYSLYTNKILSVQESLLDLLKQNVSKLFSINQNTHFRNWLIWINWN